MLKTCSIKYYAFTRLTFNNKRRRARFWHMCVYLCLSVWACECDESTRVDSWWQYSGGSINRIRWYCCTDWTWNRDSGHVFNDVQNSQGIINNLNLSIYLKYMYVLTNSVWPKYMQKLSLFLVFVGDLGVFIPSSPLHKHVSAHHTSRSDSRATTASPKIQHTHTDTHSVSSSISPCVRCDGKGPC